MIWLIIILLFILLLLWFLLAPVEFTLDTRSPEVCVRWISIGKVMIIYEEEEWWMDMRLLVFHRRWTLRQMFYTKKRKAKAKVKKQRRTHKRIGLQKLQKLFKTFRVKEWKAAIDSGDNAINAWLYPMNFLPLLRHHLFVNFMDENYLAFTISNTPWRMINAWLK